MYDENAHAVALDRAGHIYVTGIFQRDIAFGPESALRSTDNEDGLPSQDGFLAEFDADGLYVSSRVLGEKRSDRVGGLLIDPDGRPIVSGRFSGLVDVGSGRLLSLQYLDFFIAVVAR